MAGYRAALLNFTRGWVSPEVESRFDLSAYQAGLREATNVKIKRTGGVSKRMGTRYVATALAPESRLFPFQFNDDQAYALEMGQAYMRPIALGGAVLEEGLLVTGITNAANAQITAAYHGYEVGDPVYLAGITGMPDINDRFLTVLSVSDINTFAVDYDSTGQPAFTGSGGGTARVAAPDPPPAPPPVPPEITPDPAPSTGTGGVGGYDSGGGWSRPGGSIGQNMELY